MDLSQFENFGFSRGRPTFVEALWLIVQASLINSWIPGSAHRKWFLRIFGAKIGDGVVLKPYLRVKFPWRLSIGDHSWVGESVWIDNLENVEIADNVCISQGVYLCTGGHDWSAKRFTLSVSPVQIADSAWICARANLAPGTQVGEGVVVAFGSSASGRLEPWHVYQGVPAVAIRKRAMSGGPDASSALVVKSHLGG